MKRAEIGALAVGEIGLGNLPHPAHAARRMTRQGAAQTEEQRLATHPVLDTATEVGRFDGVPVREGHARVPDDVDGVEMGEMTKGLHGARERDAVEGLGRARIGQRRGRVFAASIHAPQGATLRGASQLRVARGLVFIAGFGGLAGLALAGGCLGDEPGLVADGNDADTAEVIDFDRVDASCQGGAMPAPVACGAAQIAQIANRGQDHVPDGTPIGYEDSPPSSGDHRPSWGRWGEYRLLPPQRWLHNLEHGGVAFLYDPCAAESVVSALREAARALPADESGPARWVLTPYPGLPTGVAVVAWEWTWQAECVDAGNAGTLQSFITEHYRKAPEDVAVDGSFAVDWIGR